MSLAYGVPQSEWTESILRESFDLMLQQRCGVAVCEGSLDLDTQASDAPERSVSGVASVESVSRTGLKILVAGLDVSYYNDVNPIVLAGHNCIAQSSLLPGAIGTVRKVSKRGSSLLFKDMTFDTDPLSDAWYQKVLNRTIRTVSIGVRPLEVEFKEETIGKGKNQRIVRFLEFTKSELLEISPVCIPANLGAIITPPKSQTKSQEECERLTKQVDSLTERVDEFFSVLRAAQAEDGKASIDNLLSTLEQLKNS